MPSKFTGIVSREGPYWPIEFPEAPGCQTFAESLEELSVMAQDALDGWLEAGGQPVCAELPSEVERTMVVVSRRNP